MTFFSFMLYLFLSVGLAFLSIKFVGEGSKISGSSMEPHFKQGDYVIIEKLSYRFRKPKRFDTIVIPFKSKGLKKEYYLKRVIALPGETIQIKQGNIYINDQKLEEPYDLEPIKRPGLAKKKITLNNEEYFLLGDNRNDSLDSRDPSIGMVIRKDIVGRGWIRLWPLVQKHK